LAAVFLPESLPQAERRAMESAQGLVDLRAWLRAARGPLAHLFVLVFISTCGLMIFASVFGLYALERYGFGPADVGVMLMVLGLASAAAQGLLVGPMSRRWGDESLVQGGLLATAVTFGLMLLADDYVTILLSTAAFGLTTALQVPALMSLTSKRTTTSQGVAMGLSNSFVSLGRIVGPILGGLAFDIGMRLPYVVGTFIMVGGFGLSVAWLRRSSRSPAAAIIEGSG
jgi:DHA1 family multidrug resistance protein-like MFS transporter